MPDGTLYIGTKRNSSWSLRGWLPVRLAGLDVEEVLIPLDQPDTAARIAAVSPNRLVPCLHHKGAVIWDSLAIAEYCAELSPGLWPAEARARAHARSIAAEMHSGFRALRQAMWMNTGAEFSARAAGKGRTPEALADITRIEALWADTRARFGAGGPFLFGAAFTNADVMYAPVVTRFLTWAPELTEGSRAYVAAVRAHPLVDRWYREAEAEPAAWRAARYETVTA
ncbi:MAG: glutathione S-transferase family protein [Acetobacteraceae bacterium]|jgi:glutathione S-transferase|nr:glutathione S-transferase family protein [Acetobacteraceae bacterium]